MADKYKTHSTSSQSLKVEDRVISENTKTRRIIRPEIVDNQKEPTAGVKISILHQRVLTNGVFEDLAATPLSTLKAGEIGKLILDSSETKKLYEELINLFAIHKEKGVPRGDREIVVGFDDEIIKTDPRRASLIRTLIERGHSEEVWHQLVESDPDLATRLSMARLHQSRANSLEEFSSMLGKNSSSENDWQAFFEKNTWIFGYGLNYSFLKTVTTQPNYGGRSVHGSGESKGDFLQSSEGNLKFTVLIEIKKPQSDLLCKKPYRNDCYVPSEDLLGGTSQLRTNARRWENEGSTTEKNRDDLEAKNIYTIRPKQILVIGNTNQLANRPERDSFELFRRGQSDIEILTFDEVFQRAKFIVEHSDEAK